MWRSLLLTVCACNQVFGITDTSGPDSDGDGVMDGRDNCALVANPKQQDADSDFVGDACDPCVDGPASGLDDDTDGVDDACDPCLTGSNLDEDSDGFLDGCDVCPGTGDDQMDDDGDGIGNACDRSPGVLNQRVAFDGFAPPRASWITGFQAWSVNDVGFGPVPPFASGNIIGAYDSSALIDTTVNWWIEVALHLPPDTWTDGTNIQLAAVTTGGGFAGRDCALYYSSGKWSTFGSSTPIPIGEEVRILLRVTGTAAGECIIDGTLVGNKPTSGIAEWYALLQASTRVEFRWIDIVK